MRELTRQMMEGAPGGGGEGGPQVAYNVNTRSFEFGEPWMLTSCSLTYGACVLAPPPLIFTCRTIPSI